MIRDLDTLRVRSDRLVSQRQADSTALLRYEFGETVQDTFDSLIKSWDAAAETCIAYYPRMDDLPSRAKAARPFKRMYDRTVGFLSKPPYGRMFADAFKTQARFDWSVYLKQTPSFTHDACMTSEDALRKVVQMRFTP